MNKKMLGIGAIAALATMLIVTSSMSTNDVFAKRYGNSNAQSAAVSNECNALGAQGISLGVANTICFGDGLLNQGDGAAQTSSPSSTNLGTLGLR
jgi:hypothetical protein